MQFTETSLAGAYLIDPSPIEDQRGWFARVFCAREFRHRGLPDTFVQMNHAKTAVAGIIRGLHYQIPPAEEAKLIRCIRGSIYDVFVDVRRGSPTFLQWYGVELTAENRRMAYIPPGFAHGYQALLPDSEVIYQASAEYAPEYERQVRCDDPLIGIEWPISEFALSPKDQATPHLDQHFTGVVL